MECFSFDYTIYKQLNAKRNWSKWLFLSEPDIFQGVETWNIIMQITNL